MPPLLPLRKLPWCAQRPNCVHDMYSTACIGLLPCICHNRMYGLYGQYVPTYYMQVVLSGPSSPVWTSQDPHPIPGHGPSINRSIDQPINRHSLPTVQCLPTYLTLVASYIHPVLSSPEQPFSLSSPPQTVPLVTGRPSQRRAATSIYLPTFYLGEAFQPSAGPGLGHGATAQNNRGAPG